MLKGGKMSSSLLIYRELGPMAGSFREVHFSHCKQKRSYISVVQERNELP